MENRTSWKWLQTVLIIACIATVKYYYHEKQQTRQKQTQEFLTHLQHLTEARAPRQRHASGIRPTATDKAAGEQKASERQRLVRERELAERMSYKIGNLYNKNGIRGLVARPATSRTPGLLISLNVFHGDWQTACAMCKNGWRLPTLEELTCIRSDKERLDTQAVAHGGARLGDESYWASGNEADKAVCFSMRSGTSSAEEKTSENFIRPVRDL